jgi:DNA polymerase III epsilon subunit-like protein
VRPAAQTGDPYAPWWEHNLVIFDVETTGLKEEDRVIEVGLARFEKGQCVDQWGTLIYPDMEIPGEATAIHGISTADVASSPRFIGAIPNVLRIAHDAWPVAYNASFDRRFWMNEMGRTAVTGLHVPIFDPSVRWLDPLTWLRKLDGVWGKNKLTIACERWGVSLLNAHRATDDAVAAGNLLFKLTERIPPWTITELLRRQQNLDEQQDEERRAWFAKKGLPYR